MSGTSQIFLDIKNRLEDVNPYFSRPTQFSKTNKFVYIWNDSVSRLREGKYAGLQPPYIFIELLPFETPQYGNGNQIYQLTIRIHIVHKFFNANDNVVNFDQDLEIYEIKDWVYSMLNMFQPTNCGVMMRLRETPPDNHDMLVEYIQEYGVLYTDSLLDQPLNGGQMDVNTGLDNTMTITQD